MLVVQVRLKDRRPQLRFWRDLAVLDFATFDGSPAQGQFVTVDFVDSFPLVVGRSRCSVRQLKTAKQLGHRVAVVPAVVFGFPNEVNFGRVRVGTHDKLGRRARNASNMIWTLRAAGRIHSPRRGTMKKRPFIHGAIGATKRPALVATVSYGPRHQCPTSLGEEWGCRRLVGCGSSTVRDRILDQIVSEVVRLLLV